MSTAGEGMRETPSAGKYFRPNPAVFVLTTAFRIFFFDSMKKSTAKEERLFLLDGMALAYRAYFAFIQRPLINSRGENTSAVFGFVTFLNRILTQESPDHIAVVFDTPAPTFRHKAYKEYKATRQKMPEDMISQIPILKDVVRAYNIPSIELDGYEADDIIGTLARKAADEHISAFLVTPDKDYMQLVDKKTKMYKPGKGGTDVEIIDIAGVKEKFGVSPDRVTDVLGLTGDSSDNVPGVPGVGEKTAIPLVQKYGSIESIYEHIAEIPQKGLRSKLESHKELAFLSKRLVTIDINVPLDIDVHGLRAMEQDKAKLIELFGRLEFRSLITKLRTEGEPVIVPAAPSTDFVPSETMASIRTGEHRYTLITEESGLKELCRTLSEAEEFVFDTETTSRDALRAELVGISFSLIPHEAFYVAILPPGDEASGALFPNSTMPGRESRGISPETACKYLRKIMEEPKIRKIGHNIKYDMLVLSNYGIAVEGAAFDTMIASYILRADGQHNMDALAAEHLKYRTITFSDLTGTGKEQKSIREIPLAQVSDYSCEDSDITFQLYRVLKSRIDERGMQKLSEEVEFPLIPVLARMEAAGVVIDVAYLAGMSKELERQLDALTRDIHREAGGPFNINSTQQLAEILFNRLKLPPVRKTKTSFSTDVGVLETLRNAHPIIEKLLNYRQLIKLKSTYVDALPELIHPKTKRVHTSFNQTVALTGRLSSSDPNLQNIPIRTEIGRSIRKAFVAGDAKSKILSADYSQIELRVMAHISGDEGLAEAFRNHEDIHASTAAKVFGVEPADVSRDMRRKAKEVNFGIMYGIGPYGLSSRLEISQSEAKDIIARYFERFPKVQQYINDTIALARRQEYVSTLLGRRRYFPDIHSHNQNIRQNAERQAINMPIQGTAADMIKIAMVHIDSGLKSGKLSSLMLLQVHDELVFEVRGGEEEAVRALVEREMQQALPLSVPVEVEIGIGKNWLEAH
jgi:DNA polymerase-1